MKIPENFETTLNAEYDNYRLHEYQDFLYYFGHKSAEDYLVAECRHCDCNMANQKVYGGIDIDGARFHCQQCEEERNDKP